MTPLDFTAFDHLGALVVVLDPEAAIVHWNRACSELTGHQLDDVRGRRLWDLLLPPEEATRMKSALGKLRSDRQPSSSEWTWALKPGELRTIAVSSSVVLGADGDVELLVLTGVDQDTTTQEQRLRNMLSNAIVSIAADAVISIDAEQRIVLYNAGAEKIFGWSSTEVLGRPLDILIPERLRKVHRQHVRRFAAEAVASRRVDERHTQIFGLRKTGEEFPAEAAISRVETAGKRIFTVMLRDTSDRRRFEEALHVHEERLKVALQASPAVVFNQDLELRYTWIHDPKESFTAEQVLGKTDFDLFPHADAERLAALKRGVLGTGMGARTVVRTTIQSEARYHDLTIEPLRDASGRIVGITCASWDVTDQQWIAGEQRYLAEYGAALMNAAPDYEAMLTELARLAVREIADWAVVDVVEAGQPRRLKVACSDPAKHELAAALEGIALGRDRPHLMFEPLQDRRATLVTDVTPEILEALAQSSEHLRLLRALDARSFIAAPLMARGHLLGSLALVSSRESRRYRQPDLRFAEELARVAALAVDNAQLYRATQRAIAARDNILGIVAHDLRNPLNAVLLQSERLRRGGPEDARRSHQSVEAIRRAARRMNRLIEDMLDVARLEGGSLAIECAAIPARSVLEEGLETQRAEASKAGLEVRLDVADELPSVFADHDRLLQVFDNLIGNAIKFTPPGGDIVIGAAPRAAEVHFWVTDTGSGVAPEQLTHLFDRFWQAEKTDRRGAGLGLGIVKGIIEAHGGRIWAESQIGKGTTFSFTVPVASTAENHASPS